jgi:hypothetical protein
MIKEHFSEMVILKTKWSKALSVLLCGGTGKLFKKAIEIRRVRKIELIGNLLYRFVAAKLPFYFRDQLVMNHLLRG